MYEQEYSAQTTKPLTVAEESAPIEKKADYVKELDGLYRTLTLIGELQDRMHHKTTPVRAERLSKAEPIAEPTSSTGESPLVTALKGLNYQATRILQNFSNTYDEIDL